MAQLDKLKHPKQPAADKLESALASTYSNLYHFVRGADGWLFNALNVARRGNNDWLAVCKVTMLPELTHWVAFGAGRTYFEAIHGLNASIAAGKWRIDKPWDKKHG